MHRSNLLAVLSSGLVVGAALASCSSDHSFDCVRNEDCSPGMICWQEICQIPFGDAGDSAIGSADAGCTRDDQCGPGEWCRNERCVPAADTGPGGADAEDRGDEPDARVDSGPDGLEEPDSDGEELPDPDARDASPSEAGPEAGDAGEEFDAGCVPVDEVCDGDDNDCDGRVDEEDALDATEWYVDADGDGFGSGSPQRACEHPLGRVDNADDCDDGDDRFHPGAEESCDDPTDWNCDGSTAWEDGDADGSPACLDCDDRVAALHPGAEEVVGDELDEDCDGHELCFADADSDGFRSTAVVDSANLSCSNPGEAREVDPGGDCDDADAAAFPGANEYCDGEDDDCDSEIDEGVPVDAATWFEDADSDGYGGPDPARACSAPEGHVALSGDCDDDDAAFYPGAVESCSDPRDLNCDGSIAFQDADTDGVPACEDCDDADPNTWPGAPEACDDPVDRNCDGEHEYLDLDRDGWAACRDCADWLPLVNPGVAERPGDEIDDNCDGIIACWVDADADSWPAEIAIDSEDGDCLDPGEGISRGWFDCDDTTATAQPGRSIEVCDGLDNDCDGLLDNDDPDLLYAPHLWLDTDEDGFGDNVNSVQRCAPWPGYAQETGDCDDGDPAFYPGADEPCPGPALDTNCDGTINASDYDLDGSLVCLDCDDADPERSPEFAEIVGNSIDDDCDGVVLCYADADRDGWRTDEVLPAPTGQCTLAEGLASAGVPGPDCDDGDALRNPAATELCESGRDEDCDGLDPWCAPTGTLYVGDASRRIVGAGATGIAGYSLGVGDIDGDGVDDLVLALAAPVGTGQVAVQFGDPAMESAPVNALAFPSWTAESPMDSLGASISLGDINADGLDDVLLGAPQHNSGASSGGAVFLLRGGVRWTGARSVSTGVRIVGGTDLGLLGTSVLLADVNGDGYDDAILGEPGTSGVPLDGAVFVFTNARLLTGTLGASLAYPTITGRGGLFGSELAAGLVTADGTRDLLIGSPLATVGGAGTPGRVAVITGASAWPAIVDLSSSPGLAQWLDGSVDGERAGDAMTVRDGSGSGRGRVVVGLPTSVSALGAGAIRHVDVTPALPQPYSLGSATAMSGTAGEGLGSALAQCDVDGDGMLDLVVGALGATSPNPAQSGTVRIVYRAGAWIDAGSTPVVAYLHGDAAVQMFGASVACGDFNGDGYDDVAVGAPGDLESAVRTGSVSIFWGGLRP